MTISNSHTERYHLIPLQLNLVRLCDSFFLGKRLDTKVKHEIFPAKHCAGSTVLRASQPSSLYVFCILLFRGCVHVFLASCRDVN